MDTFFDFVFEKVVIPGTIILLAAVLAFVFIAGPISFYHWCNEDHTKFQLEVKDWDCSNTETRTYPITIMAGKVPVTTMQTTTKCVQWTKRK